MVSKRGRKPKPTALKALHNAGRRPLNGAEPEAPAIADPATDPASNVVSLPTRVTAVEAPAHVTGAALEIWNELAPSLATARVLTKWDRYALARYCNAVKTEIQAQEKLEEIQKTNVLAGLLTKTPNGMWTMGALLIVRNAAARDAAKFGALLGLDPSSRSAIKIEKQDEGEEWDRYRRTR